MFTAKTKTITMMVIVSLLHVACAPNKNESNNEDPAISAMSSQLQSVGDEFLPASVNEDGRQQAMSTKVDGKLATQSNNGDDICAGADFIECQPKLIRAYLKMGREGVYSTQRLVAGIARGLSGVAENTSGEFRDDEKNLRIAYNKRTSTDFDVLMYDANIPAGKISAKNGVYNIQFDMSIVERDKPDNRGGKMDIQVTFTDRTHWDSQITITGMKCSEQKPEDPENARIHVKRNGDLWQARSMFYSGIAAHVQSAKSCAIPASDATGLVVYTDLVADVTAAKSAIYMLKRSEQSSTQLQNYGINNYCQNYPDLCQSLAAAIGTTPASVNTHLSALQNPYCVHRGNSQVFWNSNCSTVSEAVANASLAVSGSLLSPYDFYRLSITIPNQL
jgi:hypothetical protein